VPTPPSTSEFKDETRRHSSTALSGGACTQQTIGLERRTRGKKLAMKTEKIIARGNDKFRHEATTGAKPSMPGMIVATRKVQALPDAVKRRMIELIRDYDRFDDGDDQFPDQHDGGQFSIGEQMFVWKIDWTADPTGIVIPESDKPETYFRVLTIMLAEEA